jgi:hypothetical protein
MCIPTTQRSDKDPTGVNDGAYQKDGDASCDCLVALLSPAQLVCIHISANDVFLGLPSAFSYAKRVVARVEMS